MHWSSQTEQRSLRRSFRVPGCSTGAPDGALELQTEHRSPRMETEIPARRTEHRSIVGRSTGALRRSTGAQDGAPELWTEHRSPRMETEIPAWEPRTNHRRPWTEHRSPQTHFCINTYLPFAQSVLQWDIGTSTHPLKLHSLKHLGQRGCTDITDVVVVQVDRGEDGVDLQRLRHHSVQIRFQVLSLWANG